MDSEMNDKQDKGKRGDMPIPNDAAPQADEFAVKPAPTPQLLLTAGPTQAENAPPQASKSTASKKASTGGDPQSKPGVAYEGKAVIDRFEGKWAVLLVGDDEKSVAVLRKSLPKRVKAGEWLNVQLDGAEGDEVVKAEVDHEETARMSARIAEKLARLRSGAYLKDEGGDQ